MRNEKNIIPLNIKKTLILAHAVDDISFQLPRFNNNAVSFKQILIEDTDNSTFMELKYLNEVYVVDAFIMIWQPSSELKKLMPLIYRKNKGETQSDFSARLPSDWWMKRCGSLDYANDKNLRLKLASG
ncbi:MAG: hypothetical protein HRU38_08640 [Saccharospirillaceae bacterium]|nr:hypothetical protein [Pseudomonadales bacterium]NRB78720.1 hypothetical protein [Saccharospirillaceae bacterium]